MESAPVVSRLDRCRQPHPAPTIVRLLGCVVALVLASASAATAAAPHHAVVVHRVGNVLCGHVGATWLPGERSHQGFVSDAQLIRRYRAQARGERGATRSRDLARAAALARRAAADGRTCLHLSDPVGAVKLTAKQVRRAGSVTCGYVHAGWISGVVLPSGYFISDAQQATNYDGLARHARGRAKKQALASAAKYRRTATAGASRCAVHTTSPTGPLPTGMNTPLRFNIRDAIGLALRGSGTAAASADAARPVARTAAAGSNLEALGAGGQTWDAVGSGSANVSHFFIAPSNKVYVLFDGGAFVSVSGTPKLCALAEVDRDTGEPTCIDESSLLINWLPGSGDPIQFDGSGAIYYSACDRGGGATCYLRRYLNGVTTDVISVPGSEVTKFVVNPDGSVIASMFTFTSGPAWTEAVSPSGEVKRLFDHGSSLTRFPDGNLYTALYDPATGINGVVRYLTQTGQMDPEYWVSGTSQGQSTHNDAEAICAQATAELQATAFCAWRGGGMGWAMSTSDGKEFVTVGAADQSVLMQYYPTVQFTSTSVLHPTAATAVGDKLALAGLDAGGNRVLALYDPATGTDRQLPTPGASLWVTSMAYSRSTNVLLVGGQDASNPFAQRSVQIDLTTGQLSPWSNSELVVNSLQAFYAIQS